MIRNELQEAIKVAMKNRDSVRLEALRFVWSEMKNMEIDAKHELSDDELTQLLLREVKRRRDAIAQFKAGGREDLVQTEQQKLDFIIGYLPKQLTEAEVEAIVREIASRGETDFGTVMREAMGKLKGKADGKLVADIVRKVLVNSGQVN